MIQDLVFIHDKWASYHLRRNKTEKNTGYVLCYKCIELVESRKNLVKKLTKNYRNFNFDGHLASSRLQLIFLSTFGKR